MLAHILPPVLDGTLHGLHLAQLKSFKHKHVKRAIREEICFKVCLFVLSKFFISWVGLMNCFIGFFKATSPHAFCACFITCFNHFHIKT